MINKNQRDHVANRAMALDTLRQEFARADHIAWAIVELTVGNEVSESDRYRKILGVSRWMDTLTFWRRTSDGRRAKQPKGEIPFYMDVREFKYMKVSDVRRECIKSGFWPEDADF